ncbi:prostacyclin receptor [Erpetoichthys calabaricus]|uniref:prostacyclin receptor n=1 Tax=Erpetoichthys calabaricus TaxID=27687 RepID=UPI0022346210|nr:prostacyclin receptor [Erpetoichthys calabaricus]
MANVTCEKITQIRVVGYPMLSTWMFVIGVGGNVLALAILGVHRKKLRSKSSVFCILVTGLAVTDLLGTCFLSPLVFVSYAYNASIVGLVGNHSLCDFFGFTTTFSAVASMLILCAMAVERCMAISHPYFYSKHNSKGLAKAALASIYVLSCFFCCLPFFAFGEHKQYCPGTWCFIKMASTDRKVIAFSLCYATLMAFLILIILICNGSVIVSLCNMYKNQRSRRGSVISNRTRKNWIGQGDEEVDQLILLASMTTIFVICSLPITIRGFVSAIAPSTTDLEDLIAFRLSATNPIADPWIFIIFRKTVFRHLRSFLCCRFSTLTLKSKSYSDSCKLQSVPFKEPSLSNSHVIPS